ncbi:hypothetical protein [Nocardia sp. NPDC005366]|uniref:hypothetical protein n=1 Tax=Nocardia sp. NPDC005366 TaxID=3156878 RepID=UPI0033BA2812
MTTLEVDARRLRSEIAAFYAGFGQPNELKSALREASLLVPLTDDDRVFTLTYGGVQWLCGFTDITEYARFMTERGVVADQQYRFHTFQGSRLIDFAAEQVDPTGVAVDMLGAAPMAFGPDLTADATAFGQV